MTTQTATRNRKDIEQQLADLRARLPALALDNKTAELLDVERAILDGERQLERLRLAGIERDRRDAEAQRQAEAAAREQARLAAIAWEKQRIKNYAAVTAACDALTAALRTALADTGGTGTTLQLADYVAGELTAAGIYLFGLHAPRRPLLFEGSTA